MNKTYIVAGHKSWNRHHFDEIIKKFPGKWYFIAHKDELSLKLLKQLRPRYVFFLHWSYIVPKVIVKNYECVCFHMTDLPYGRGGTPLQNLIVRGHNKTKITALRMNPKVDAGPVYMKRWLSLKGSAEEIYIRASRICAEMISDIVGKEPEPSLQTGKVVIFKRRTPKESQITRPDSLEKIYDMIRMLDAEGYPKAFIEKDGFRYELNQAVLNSDCIEAAVRIYPKLERKT
jgi:methionyl-tRNA formyltransferase